MLGPGKEYSSVPEANKVTGGDKEDTLSPINEVLQGQAAANSKNPEGPKYWRLALYVSGFLSTMRMLTFSIHEDAIPHFCDLSKPGDEIRRDRIR
jgi:hypothetical protein